MIPWRCFLTDSNGEKNYVLYFFQKIRPDILEATIVIFRSDVVLSYYQICSTFCIMC